MASLCSVCANIQIRRLLTSPVANEEIELGPWSEIQERSGECSLCATIAQAVRYGPWSLRGKLKEDDEFLLVPKVTMTLHCRDAGAGIPLRIFRLHIYTEDYEDAGDLLLDEAGASIVGNPSIGHGRPVLSQQINVEEIRKWISSCEGTHHKCSDRTALESLGIAPPEQSLLIDVNRKCLVDATNDAKYAALSYKWGDAKQFLTLKCNVLALKEPGALEDCALPRTVQDSIMLTRNIGLPYIWVDALCIIQDSPEHKSKQIMKMHHVYSAATITIVAAASDHADHGIVGVRDGSRNLDQMSTTIDGLHLLARLCFLGKTMNKAEYSTRAWAYQESCLSRRLLYITSSGAVMVCSEGLYSEELVLEDNACGMPKCRDHHNNIDTEQRNLWREYLSRRAMYDKEPTCNCLFRARECFLLGQQPKRLPSTHDEPNRDTPFSKQALRCADCMAFLNSNDDEWLMYKELVKSYTHRQMRFESDRLPAFSGIAGFLSQVVKTEMLYGLPEKYLDLALRWCPSHKLKVPCRRTGLLDIPTWSWASHEISAGFGGENWLTSEVDWYRADKNRLRPVHSLKVFGTHVPLRKDFYKPVTASQLAEAGLLPLEPKALYGWCLVSSAFCLKDLQLHDDQGVPVKSALGYVRYSDVPPEHELGLQPVEVLCLSRSHYHGLEQIYGGGWELEEHTINLIIIHRQGNTATRLAMADIDDVVKWSNVEKQWKLIKLI